MKNIKSYVAILIAFLIIDGIWLGLIMNDFYFRSLSPLLREEFIFWPLILFYFIYALSILMIAIKPFSKKKISTSIKTGAWLGLTGYMTFDLVNYGLLESWPLSVVLIDIIWGTVLTAALAGIGAWAYRK